MDKPLVSIKTMTYNHAPFIRKCVEGVLMQKTSFCIQLVIAEDCSTDGTREIVKEYADKYPEIIKLIISDENVGVRENSLRADKACNGEYLAICEGDDYWTDPYKLQKQVDFLEANPDYGLVHTAYSSFIDSKNKIVKPKLKNIPTGDILKDLLTGLNTIATLTSLVRADVLIKAKSLYINEPRKGWKMGDLPMWLAVAKFSKVGYLSDNTATYRILDNSASHSSSIIKVIEFNQSAFNIRRWFCSKWNLPHYTTIIDENELFMNYYLSIILKYENIDLYRQKVRNHKLIKKDKRNQFLSLLSRSILLEKSFLVVKSFLF